MGSGAIDVFYLSCGDIVRDFVVEIDTGGLEVETGRQSLFWRELVDCIHFSSFRPSRRLLEVFVVQ